MADQQQKSPTDGELGLQALFRFVQTVASAELEKVGCERSPQAAGRPRARNRAVSSAQGQGGTLQPSHGRREQPNAHGGYGVGKGGLEAGARGAADSLATSSATAGGDGAGNSTRGVRGRGERSNRCQHGKCCKYASFGDPSLRVMLFCGRHKQVEPEPDPRFPKPETAKPPNRQTPKP
jgi:hypothetical protein